MKLLKCILPFLFICLLFILTGLFLVLITDKGTLHLSINTLVGGPMDDFFKYFTHIGDGITVAALIVLSSLTVKGKIIPYILLGLSSFALSGLLTQLLKRLVFNGYSRPLKFFGPENLNLIEGVKLHGSYSFPSGHSTASFALFIFLAFVFRKTKYAQVFFGILAILAAYSRVHISQHFVQDIICGATIGVSIFFFTFWLMNKYIFKTTFKAISD